MHDKQEATLTFTPKQFEKLVTQACTYSQDKRTRYKAYEIIDNPFKFLKK